MGYVLSAATAAKVRELVAVDGLTPGQSGGYGQSLGSKTVAFVRITNDVPDDDGFYRGVPTQYLTLEDSYESYAEAKVIGANSDDLAFGTRYLALRAGDDEDGVAVFVAYDPWTLTVAEKDGTPSYDTITELRFDPADGFILTHESGSFLPGRITVDLASATPTQNGIVDTSAQSFAGKKEFDDAVQVGNGTINQGGGYVDFRSVTGSGDAGGTLGLKGGTSFFGCTAWQDRGGAPFFFVDNYASWTLIPEAFPGTGCFQIVQRHEVDADFPTGYADAAYAVVDSNHDVWPGAYGTTGGLVFKGGLYVSGSLSVSWAGISSIPAAVSAVAALTPAADKLAYYTGTTTAALTDLTSTARSLLDDTSTSAMRTTLGLAIGTDVQAWSGQLDSMAAVSLPLTGTYGG